MLIEVGSTIHKFNVENGEEQGQIEEYGQEPSTCPLVVSENTIYGCQETDLIGYDIQDGDETFRVLVGEDDCTVSGCYGLWARPFVLDGEAVVMSKAPDSDYSTMYKLIGIGAS